MASGGLTVIDRGFDAVSDFLSVTVTVKVVVPVEVGVPLTIPVVAKVRPGGKVPADTDHVYGAIPPLAVNV